MRGGGSEHQVALLAEHLPRDRFEVHLFLTHRVGELLDRLPADVPIHSVPSASPTLLERWINRWPGRILRNQSLALGDVIASQKIDVVYDRAFHNTLIAGHEVLCRQAFRENPFRRVSTIVSPPDRALPTVEKRFVEFKRKRLADAYRRSDAVIAVSQAVADSAVRYYDLDRRSIHVVENPIDIDAVVAAGLGAAREAAATNFLTLVCVGRMTIEKGQMDLVEAIARLPIPWPAEIPKLRVRFIGDGPLRGKIQKRVDQITSGTGQINGHRIEFLGTISPALPHIAAAEGLVCPSHFEGMPNVVLEAFALNTSVVATRAGGTAELIGSIDQPNGWAADPDDPDSLASAMFAMACDRNERSHRSQRAARWVREHHGIGQAIEKLVAILDG